jgi:hypothetical protein
MLTTATGVVSNRCHQRRTRCQCAHVRERNAPDQWRAPVGHILVAGNQLAEARTQVFAKHFFS